MDNEIASTIATSLLEDQRVRWERGERVSVEKLVELQPEIQENTELLLDLIYAEVVLRGELGEKPTPEEYIARFPELAESIQTQFELDAAIDVGVTQLADPNYVDRSIELPMPTQIGRFHILRELGRGGFGIVYLAHDSQLGRRVALKVPRADIVHSAELRQRFQQEARAAAGLDHPNLVPVYESGEVDSLCYIVSAYCPGINLADWMRGRTEPVPFADAARIIRSLADGVQHSHSKGILHRDLKPANVLLVTMDISSGSNGGRRSELPSTNRALLSACQPKITDFGLAKLSGADVQTKTGTTMGTPAYMAPEQATAYKSEVGPAADVYSLGVMLYELLTGRPPFVADSPIEVMLAVQKEEPVPPSRLRQRLPRDLDTICLKCLEKEPHRRYASAKSLAEDLGRYLAGNSIVARPLGVFGRSFRWGRRRPATAALLAMLMLTLTAGVSGIGWQWWRADNHAHQARVDRDVARLAQRQAGHDRDAAQQSQKKEAEALDRHRIIRAYDEWQSDNSQAARDLLRDAVARKDTWEYRYVDRLCNLGLFVDEHESAIGGAAFTPDGGTLISASRDGVVLSHDLLSGKTESASILVDRPGSISRMSLNRRDGRQLATTTTSGMILIWDLQQRKVATSWKAHNAATYLPLAYSPRGRYLATAAEMSVKVWDVAEQKEVHAFRNTHRILDMCWSPDKRFLVYSAFAMNSVRIREIATGEETKIPTVRWMATSVAFSPDGKRVAWAGIDGLVSVYDATDSFRQIATLSGTPGYQSCLAFSPDGRSIVAGSRNGPARMWQVETGQLISTIHGHSSGVRDVAFSPDGSLLATVGADRRIIVSDLLDYQEVSSLIDFTPWRLHAATFSADGRRLLAATNQFRLFDVERRSAISTTPVAMAISVAAHPKDDQFAGGDETGKVRILDKLGKETASRQMKGYPLALRYVEEGRRLLVAGWDNAVYSWIPGSTDAPELVLGPLGGANRRRSWQGDCLAAFSSAGDLLVYVERGQPPVVWDLKTREKLATLEEVPASITSIALDRDGRQLALGGRKGEVQIRDVRSGRLTATLIGHPLELTGLAFTPDGSRLASSAGDGVVKLWDPLAAVEVLSLRGHATYDSILAFSPDGELCVVGGWDGFLRMWNIRDPHSETEESRLERRRFWHLWHAEDGVTTKRWFVAAHHRGQLILMEPDRWQHRQRRAGALASMGEWDRAAADLDEAISNPGCGAIPFVQRADLYLRAADFDGYRRVCERARERFASSELPDIVNSLLWMCALHESAATLAKELIPLGRAALARATPTGRQELLNTLGALLYRVGQTEEAIKLFEESVKVQAKGGFLEDWLFLAMAHHKLGRKEKADECYARVAAEIKKLHAGTPLSDGRTVDWRLRVELDILHEELKREFK
jgi:WD40 repeat protein